jgi:hypothetical protein
MKVLGILMILTTVVCITYEVYDSWFAKEDWSHPPGCKCSECVDEVFMRWRGL